MSTPDLPAGPFTTVVADPPWDYGRPNQRSSAGKHYRTMRNEEIAALPVRHVVAESAHLYLWVTNPRLFGSRNGDGPSPLEIMQAWGFEYRTMLTWVKEGAPGMGWYFRGDTEHVLFGTRGKAPIPPALRVSNTFRAKRGRHSEKPDVFYGIVERVSPLARLEMFARRARPTWTAWGNQVGALDEAQGDLLNHTSPNREAA